MSNVIYLPARQYGKTLRFEVRMRLQRAKLAQWSADLASLSALGAISPASAKGWAARIARQRAILDAMAAPTMGGHGELVR